MTRKRRKSHASKKRKRNYRAEYRRRMARGKVKGLSPSQARGHAKGSEKPNSAARFRPLEDKRFQRGLRLLREDKNLAEIAKELGTSRERLVRQIEVTNAARKRGLKWIVRDDLPRQMLLYSGGKEITITVANRRIASIIGLYMSQVGQFVRTNDPSWLSLFEGRSVTDINGVKHPFEVDPNQLYELTTTGTESFESIYRIVV
jgi:hypothetical protein